MHGFVYQSSSRWYGQVGLIDIQCPRQSEFIIADTSLLHKLELSLERLQSINQLTIVSQVLMGIYKAGTS